jgi:hypothetical protein
MFRLCGKFMNLGKASGEEQAGTHHGDKKSYHAVMSPFPCSFLCLIPK